MNIKESDNDKTIVKVKLLFPIKEKQCIYANLGSFYWEFYNFGLIYLCISSHKIRMKYTAFANVNGTPALELHLADEKYGRVEDVCVLLKDDSLGDIFIERVS